MTPIRDQYLTAAETALALLETDAVAKAWTEPSALEGFTVGGLAAHLSQQLTFTAAALAADFAGKAVVGLFEHYDRASWLAADIDNDYNTAIRAGGEQDADAGHAAVTEQARTALDTLRERLPALPADHVAANPRWPYATTLDDFLHTRILEIVVHCDDLAHSTGVDTPTFDQDVFDTAVWMLGRLAAKRHGQVNLVRALARDERAPASISGL